MGFDQPPSLDEVATLKARREALRALAIENARHVRSLQLPETWLEAERATRAIRCADRFLYLVPPQTGGEEDKAAQAGRAQAKAERVAMLRQYNPDLGMLSDNELHRAGEAFDDMLHLPDEEVDRLMSMTGAAPAEVTPMRDPERLALRDHADRVLEAAAFIARPDSFLEGERAQRYALAADRMLVQLYDPPAPKRSGGQAADIDDPDAYAFADERDHPDYCDRDTWAIFYVVRNVLARQVMEGRAGFTLDSLPECPLKRHMTTAIETLRAQDAQSEAEANMPAYARPGLWDDPDPDTG